MKTPPKISALMPAYNAAQYIRATIDSVLSQTEQDFELLIINDGSTDDTEKIVREYDSPKIIYHTNPQNFGIAKTYNRTMQLARGKYLAIAESDDISHPQRFEVQARWLDENPTIGVVNAQVKTFSGEPPILATINAGSVKPTETAPQLCARVLHYGALINHQVIMYRADTLRQHNMTYDERFVVAFDTDFFMRITQVTDLINLDCELLAYRLHTHNTSAINYSLGKTLVVKLFVEFINRNCQTKINPEWFDDIKQIKNIDYFAHLIAAIEEFVAAQTNNPRYDTKTLRKRAALLLYGHILGLTKHTPPREIYAAYRQSTLLKQINLERKLRLFAKALTR